MVATATLPPPPAPALEPARRGLTRLIVVTILACSLGLMAVLALLLMLMRGSDASNDILGTERFVELHAIPSDSPDALTKFNDSQVRFDPSGSVDESTVRAIATLDRKHDQVTIYSWDQVSGNVRSSCFGPFSTEQNGGACVSGSATEPMVQQAFTDSPDGTVYSVAVGFLPAEAKWMHTTTEDGFTVGSAVIEGFAYHEWPGIEAKGPFMDRFHFPAARTVVLDADLNQIWSSDL